MLQRDLVVVVHGLMGTRKIIFNNSFTAIIVMHMAVME